MSKIQNPNLDADRKVSAKLNSVKNLCLVKRDEKTIPSIQKKPTDKDNLISNTLPPQRRTTLKWNQNGELSAIDMARVLEKIANPELTTCDFACELEDK
tara:strand:+ start:1129 stop:1425 length:297 start_codon:yes stop_codon:yes gene_type:complete